jgi:WD40 repeat protein
VGDFHKPPVQLSIVSIDSRAEQPIKGATSGSWSPDGRWLAVIRDGKLELLNAATLQRKKELGSVDVMGVWSPDSRYLVLYKSQIGCAATLYFRSLET